MNCEIKKDGYKSPREIWPEITERIEYSFTIDGRDFYSFPEFLEVPCIRAFWSLTYFEQMKTSCDQEFLLEFQKELEKVLNPLPGKPIDLGTIAMMNGFLKQRLEWTFLPRLAYQLCSVVFFDESESPMGFDQKHAAENSKLFSSVDKDFFFGILREPIRKLVPVGNISTEDLQTYLSDKQEQETAQLAWMSSRK